MKIALICTEKLPVPPVAGGAIQLYIDGVVPYLSSKHEITVFSIQYKGLPNEEVRDNVRYIRVPGRTDTIYINSLKAILQASCSGGKLPFDLIHVFNRPRFLLQLADSFPNEKFSLSLHNEMLHSEKISEEAGLRCIERSEFINTVSSYIAGTVTSRFPSAAEKMHVVYSGADIYRYTSVWTAEGARKKHEMKLKFGLQDRRVILYVGRLSIKKGVHILLKAMEKVMAAHPDTALVIAGSKWYGKNDSDDYTNSLHERIRNLPGPVVFTGFIPPCDIPDYYCMGDIFVCASQWNEPLARVHYEAMAAGLPIITTNRGGNAEIIGRSSSDMHVASENTDTGGNTAADASPSPAAVSSGDIKGSDRCGLVIDKYNDPDAMADRINLLLEQPDLALSMGKAGRKLAEEKFNWERVSQEIFERVEPKAASSPAGNKSEAAQMVQTVISDSVEKDKVQKAQTTSGDAIQNIPRHEICSSGIQASTVPQLTLKHSRILGPDSLHNTNISIVGTGYVGLVSGVCLASVGRNVLCCDQDKAKIEKLQNGILPIYEPMLQSLAENCIKKKRLSFTTDISKAVEHSDVIFITVNTPTLSDNTCDTGRVFEVAREIGKHMDRYKVIINKSTVPVGTGQNVKKVVSAMLEKRNTQIDFDVVSNPEFLKEGSAVDDFIYPDRIVIGAENECAADIVRDIYSEQIDSDTPVLVTDIETAEMIKYASNAFLATKISFVNEIANICEECGINISMVTKGMSLDTRIGTHFLNPGPGFGGSCFPKDVKALEALGRSLGCRSQILGSVLEVNERQMERMIEKIERALGGVDGRRITALGLSFKPGTDDIRESPAVGVITRLLEKNADVAVFDPQAMENMKTEHPELQLRYCSDVYSACLKSDCIVLLTEWKDFSELNFKKLKSLMRRPVFMDLRNMYDPDHVRSFGFYYEGVGRK